MSESSISSDCIDKLTHTDVLLGRGVGTNRRAGNIYFREVVSQHVEEYLISTKTHKMEITRSVIDRIHALNPPGRFMEKDEVSDRWRECEMKRAHEKTAQALRDRAAKWRTSKRQISSDAMIRAQLSRPAKKQRKDVGVNFDDVSVDAAEPVFKVNLPMKEEEEEEEEDMEALITGLYSPIFSSATSVDSAAVSTPCPISPCPSANSGVSQVNRKDSFDGMCGGLPFHMVDCNCQDQENDEFDIFPLEEDTVSLEDGMVDMPDEDIFHLWLTC